MSSAPLTPASPTIVRVGGAQAPLDVMLPYAASYLSGNGRWAYPAYDAYHQPAGGEVDDADLLAICLLNAGQKPIKSYYTLKALIRPMNERLACLDPDEDFQNAGPDTLAALADLFGILDDHRPTPEVGKTKLMKVLHRKRPRLIPLFDENIRRCYSVIGDPPLPPDSQRTNREFALAWLPHLQKDLQEQSDIWNQIVSMALPEVPISPLRAIDIIGWKLGAKP